MIVNNTQANIFKVNGAIADIFANRPPAQSSYYIFYSTDTLQIWYDNGTWLLLGSGGGGGGAVNFFLTDYATLLNDVNSSNLSPASFYLIQDRYFGILVQANSNNSITGISVQIAAPLTYNVGFFSGNNWKSIFNFNNTYLVNDVVIWGAKVWQNITGNTGTANDPYTLDNNWSLQIESNTNFYRYIWISCLYDIFSDWIYSGQYNGNRLGDVDKNTWINTYSIYGDNPINRSDWLMNDFYNNVALLINNNSGTFGGTTQINGNNGRRLISGNRTLAIVDNFFQEISNNQCLFISNNQITIIANNIIGTGFGNIEGNIGTSINGNNVNASINSNIFFQINNNSNNGSINDNICTRIIGNTNNGDILANVSAQQISNNSNTGQIYNNIVTYITNNSNNGVIVHNQGETISNNSNGSQIWNNRFLQLNSNSNTGEIRENNVAAFLNSNTLTGSIVGNQAKSIITNSGIDITDNLCSGLIINNSDEISRNVCNNIENNTGLILANFCGDDIKDNTCPGVIGNYVYAGIYNNSNNGAIEFNHCNTIFDNQGTDPQPAGKRISFNHVLGGITQNRNTGYIIGNIANNITGNQPLCTRIYNNNIPDEITGNNNTGEIHFNTNAGKIRDNNNLGDIRHNSNNGVIQNNNNNGVIRDNTNNGNISNQVAAVTDIRHNINNGDISGVNVGVISDPVVNK